MIPKECKRLAEVGPVQAVRSLFRSTECSSGATSSLPGKSWHLRP